MGNFHLGETAKPHVCEVQNTFIENKKASNKVTSNYYVDKSVFLFFGTTVYFNLSIKDRVSFVLVIGLIQTSLCFF